MVSNWKRRLGKQQGQAGSKSQSNKLPQEQIAKSNVLACDKSIACASTSMKDHVISMCVVPIIIKHMYSPKEIVTHAILDRCTQGRFAIEDLVEKLGIKWI